LRRRKNSDPSPRRTDRIRGRAIVEHESIFFHPDYTVGTGISPVQSSESAWAFFGVAGFTAGQELNLP
jgi:hypothetical protein